jgi:FkbM family methyltransferase
LATWLINSLNILVHFDHKVNSKNLVLRMARRVKKNNVEFIVEGSEDHWISFEDNSWEPGTFQILDKVLKPNYIVADIGAWIGPVSLYIASKTTRCFSFEPDPVAFKELANNLSLNKDLSAKIEAFNKAVTSDGRPVTLFSRFDYGDSGSSLLKQVKSTNRLVEVESVVFENFLAEKEISKIDFIKMDIEGGEFLVLPQMLPFLRRQKPSLLISLHFSTLCEYLELKYFPWGWMRRVYRLLDKNKKFLKRTTNKIIHKMIASLNFYRIYSEDLVPFKGDQLSFEHVDMILLLPEDIEGA